MTHTHAITVETKFAVGDRVRLPSGTEHDIVAMSVDLDNARYRTEGPWFAITWLDAIAELVPPEPTVRWAQNVDRDGAHPTTYWPGGGDPIAAADRAAKARRVGMLVGLSDGTVEYREVDQ